MERRNDVAQAKFDNCTLRRISTTTVLPTGYDMLGCSIDDTIVADLTCPETLATSTPITVKGRLGLTILRGSLPDVPGRFRERLGNQVVITFCDSCTQQPIAE